MSVGMYLTFGNGALSGHDHFLLRVQPPEPGQARTWQAWEKYHYFMYAGTALLAIAATYRPNTNPQDWARDEAEERLRRYVTAHFAQIARREGVRSSTSCDAVLRRALVRGPLLPL